MGIGAFFGKLFGTDKALEKTVDGVYNGLDKLVYTSEEKAYNAAAERSEARRMVVDWMKATQGQNLARRLIAMAITGVWLSQYVLSQLMSVVAVWSETPSKWSATSQVLTEGATDMNGAVMLILAFYFAAPHMGDIAQAVTGKFSNQVKG